MGEINGLVMKYFVVKPEGSDDYARASRAALEAYAASIVSMNPRLAEDLRNWLKRCEARDA